MQGTVLQCSALQVTRNATQNCTQLGEELKQKQDKKTGAKVLIQFLLLQPLVQCSALQRAAG